MASRHLDARPSPDTSSCDEVRQWEGEANREYLVMCPCGSPGVLLETRVEIDHVERTIRHNFFLLPRFEYDDAIYGRTPVEHFVPGQSINLGTVEIPRSKWIEHYTYDDALMARWKMFEGDSSEDVE